MSDFRDVTTLTGVCKTRTGYLRMADADGECGCKNADRKMRTVKDGWKNADKPKK